MGVNDGTDLFGADVSVERYLVIQLNVAISSYLQVWFTPLGSSLKGKGIQASSLRRSNIDAIAFSMSSNHDTENRLWWMGAILRLQILASVLSKEKLEQ